MRHVADRAPHQLSLGQRRRVAIATVLAMRPRLLVLDEPSANLDPRARRELLEVLDALDRTMLVVTHDLPFAAELCERAVILSGGRVVADGPCADDPRRRGAARGARPRAAGGLRPRGGCPRLICTLRRMADVAMPRLSDSMEEGTILKWLKSDGDEVSRGDELVEIETDKANMTYEADQDGVAEIVAQEGDTLPVGETIARIGGGSDGARAAPEEREAEAEEGGERGVRRGRDGRPRPPRREEERVSSRASRPRRRRRRRRRSPSRRRAATGRMKASPVARRMARELGLELAQLQGTGPGGRIVKADVEAAAKDGGAARRRGRAERRAPAEAEPAAPRPSRGEAKAPPPVVSGDRPDRQGRDHHAGPHAPAADRRAADGGVQGHGAGLRAQHRRRHGGGRRPPQAAQGGRGRGPAGAVVQRLRGQGAALALLDFPRANGAYRDGKFELYSRVNVGVAVAGQDALVVPTVFDADRKSLGQIARESRALAERVRAGAITPPELSSGTFTVSNLGMFGIQSFVAVINPPQAAILAVGAMQPTPGRARRRGRGPQHHALTLACDHRILYGADAAEFLGRIRERLENPLQLAL